MQKKLNDRIIFTRELFTFSDGGTVAIDWANFKEDDRKSPILAMIPGLSGNSN